MAESVRFQHFEVLRHEDGSLFELGRGAMGVTYKAFDTNLRCFVALKVINAAFLHSEVARQRFMREARAAAALRHPNVATVFHLGNEDDSYFYAMEFVPGETVEAYIKREGPVPPAIALDIALQVNRALSAASRQGLVHRDIKPSNLMLLREEDHGLLVKVIDFGLAKSVSDGDGVEVATLTAGGFLGTPHFASPEQLEERVVDVRSDIYSLGVTLWYMLAGRVPFSGSLAQVMSQHLHRDPPFQSLQGCSPSLVALLRHMMSKDPADRPQTPADLRREMEACLESLRGIPSAPPSFEMEQVSHETAILPEGTTQTAEAPTSMPAESASSHRKNALPLLGASVALLALIILFAIFSGRRAPHSLQPLPPSSVPSISAAPSPVEQDDYMTESDAADSLRRQDDLPGALNAYAALAGKYPGRKEPLEAMEMMAAGLRTRASSISDAEFMALQPSLERAANLQITSAGMLLGDRLRATDPEGALRWYTAAAGRNQTEAMVHLGQMLARGQGVPAPDLETAVEWFARAASLGDPAGMYCLAECSLLEKGTPKDPKRAVELLTTAAALGEVRSMNLLGTLYQQGIPDLLPENFDEARRLFASASSAGFLDALGNLAVMDINGQGGPRDEKKALELFKSGAEQGNPLCMYYYARCLENGVGLPKDSALARKWYITSARGGNKRAIEWCQQHNLPITNSP